MQTRQYTEQRAVKGRTRRKKKTAFQKKRINKLGLLATTFVVGILAVVIISSYMNLIHKRADLKQRAETLEQQIQSETQRTQELQQLETYTHTKRFAEETAKEVLGYVYEDEIVFKLEE